MRQLQLGAFLRSQTLLKVYKAGMNGVSKIKIFEAWRDRRGSVAAMFAFSIIPITMITGLAVDYSFYAEARSQLNLAADAAAMHAVRIASQAYGNGLTTVAAGQLAGQQAGQQWFLAQLGSLGTATIQPSDIVVNVTYTASPGGFTAVVSYKGAVPTHFGKIFNVPSWTVTNNANAVITNSYLEIAMLLDNSSSMLIGATASDILAMEQATPCSTQSASAGQGMMGNYSWNYVSRPYPALPYGYGSGYSPPPVTPVNGSCDSRYTGDPSACFYIPAQSATIPISPATGLCLPNAVGIRGGISGVPQSPCGFACHYDSGNNDYYGLARQTYNTNTGKLVTLRLDVIQQAAASVIQQMQTEQQAPNQFSVGVYEFNTALQKVYPSSGGGEAGTDLVSATSAVQSLTPQVVNNGADTDFTTSGTSLASLLTNAGDGTDATKPIKNLFIVTDGFEDDTTSVKPRPQGPMSTTVCQSFKNKGFNIYVLYTPYLPLTNIWYFNNAKAYAEPTATSPIIQALQACASSPANFFQASDPAAINTAMQQMLRAALNTPGRVAQ